MLVLAGHLEELDVISASRDEQEGSVRTWLADEPNQVLARSLFEDGFATGT